MHNYTGDPDAPFPDPPVISVIGDGDELDEAHLNPGVQQCTDMAAAYRKYGAKQNAANTFTTTNTFNGLVNVAGEIRYSKLPVTLSSNTNNQVLTPATANVYLLPAWTGGGSPPKYVLLAEPASDGAWVRIVWLEPTSTMGVVWKVKTQVGGTVLLHEDNITYSSAENDASPPPWAEFHYYSSAWHLGPHGGPYIYAGP